MSTFKAPQEMSDAEVFKKKFPGQAKPKQTDFLRKTLQGRAPKYFDSGDYNMAKNATKDSNTVTGKAIPTPDSLSQRKTSSTKQSNLLVGASSPPPLNTTSEEKSTGDTTGDGTAEQKSKQLITEGSTKE